MKALITGASSGIGRDMARVLSTLGINLILVARRGERLQALKAELSVHVQVICCDLSSKRNCLALYQRVKREQIDILINNAGLGDFGAFEKTDLEKDICIIQTNMQAVHILTKLFLKDFKQQNRGFILNVASSAAFLPGPLMATYYASKSYVYSLTLGIYQELRKAHSKVSVSVLCPGPVRTEFDKVANVRFLMEGMSSMDVARYALEQMFKRKVVIIPGMLMKTSYYLCKCMPRFVLLECSYHIQRRKNEEAK